MDVKELNYMEIIGQNIRYYRKLRGLTQESLAALTGGCSTNISLLERATGNPTMEFLMRIATALNVSVMELMDRTLHLDRAEELSWELILADFAERLKRKPLAVQRAAAILLEAICQ